ncbi:MAG: molybdopterin adenylyltransferase [Beijerinckiaceae bacterium]
MKIGILVASDRASAGIYEDRGGPAVAAYLKAVITTPFTLRTVIVPDDEAIIAAALKTFCDEDGCGLVLTTGGTGPAARDVTPEATRAVCERELPGFGEAMRTASLREVPTAILSRQMAGTRGSSLIINLPGSPRAVKTCLDAVFAAVPYGLDLIGAAHLDTDPALCATFRPKS